MLRHASGPNGPCCAQAIGTLFLITAPRGVKVECRLLARGERCIRCGRVLDEDTSEGDQAMVRAASRRKTERFNADNGGRKGERGKEGKINHTITITIAAAATTTTTAAAPTLHGRRRYFRLALPNYDISRPSSAHLNSYGRSSVRRCTPNPTDSRGCPPEAPSSFSSLLHGR